MNIVITVDSSFSLDIVNALLDTAGVAAKMVCLAIIIIGVSVFLLSTSILIYFLFVILAIM
jgi:hypothetical protein